MEIQTRLEPPPTTEATRHVELKLPESRALALAKAIDENIIWSDTEAGEELWELYQALNPDGPRGD